MDDMRDLVGAYAMDALDEDERAAFEVYLADHLDVQAEVEALRAAAAGMARMAERPPPPTLRRSVLDAIRDVEQERPDADIVPLDRRRRWWTVAAAAVIVAVVAIAGALSLLRGPSVADVLAADDARSLSLRAESLAATFTFSRELDAGVLTGTLPPVAADETYALWLIADDLPEPAGLFRPTLGRSVEVLVEGELAPGTVLGLTIEPAGGSPQPTGAILLAEALP